jgi:hypothetical protein
MPNGEKLRPKQMD